MVVVLESAKNLYRNNFASRPRLRETLEHAKSLDLEEVSTRSRLFFYNMCRGKNHTTILDLMTGRCQLVTKEAFSKCADLGFLTAKTENLVSVVQHKFVGLLQVGDGVLNGLK